MRRRGLSDYQPGTSSGSKSGFSFRKQSQTDRFTVRLKSLTEGSNRTEIAAAKGTNREDAGSQHSQSRMIKETRTFTVENSRDRGEIQFMSPGGF